MLYDPKWEAEQKVAQEPWRKVLLAAAEYIERHGLHKGYFFGPHGEACAWGAIIRVCGDPHYDLQYEATDILKRHVGGHIPTWNDAPRRTKDEVIETMRTVARG